MLSRTSLNVKKDRFSNKKNWVGGIFVGSGGDDHQLFFFMWPYKGYGYSRSPYKRHTFTRGTGLNFRPFPGKKAALLRPENTVTIGCEYLLGSS